MRAYLVCGIAILLTQATTYGQPAADLLKQLTSSDPDVRRVAAENLGKQKATEAIPALAELLKDKDWTVRKSAGDALVRMGATATPALAQALKNPDVGCQLAALEALKGLGADAVGARAAIEGSLKHKDMEVRMAAAVALGRLRDKGRDALPALFEAAKDTANFGSKLRDGWPHSVTEAAVSAALEIDGKCSDALAKAILPKLIEALASDDEGTLQAAATSLRKLGLHAKPALPGLQKAQARVNGWVERPIQEAIIAAGGEDPLAKLASDPKAPAEKRLRAISELGFRGHISEQAAAALIDAVKDKNPEIRAEAVHTLGWSRPNPKTVIPVLIGLLGDEPLHEAAARRRHDDVVAGALGRMGAEAAPALVKVFEDKESKLGVRWRAGTALQQLGRKAKLALPALENGMKDPSLALAVKSAFAYVRAGGHVVKAMPVLNEGLQSPSEFTLWHSANAVEQIGPRANKAIPALTVLLKHDDSEIRIVAARALCTMGTDARPAVPAIGRLLKEKDGRTTYQVCRALKLLGPDAKEALPNLIELFDDLGGTHPNPILQAVAAMGPGAKDAVPALIEVLKKNSDMDGDVMEVLARIGPDAKPALPHLLPYLQPGKGKNESHFRIIDAARAVGGIGPPAADAVPHLKNLLKHERRSVRVWSAYALARITGQSKAHVAFIVELWEADPEDRGLGANTAGYDAAQALELLGADAAPALDQLLKSLASERTSPGTHGHAARALGAMPALADKIVPKLIAVTELNGDFAWRSTWCVHAIEAMALLGPPASPALPRLRQLSEEDDNEIADAAVRAIEKIERK